MLETDINLHLDLQCTGQVGPSSSADVSNLAGASTLNRVEDLSSLSDDTPTRPSGTRQPSSSKAGPVVSIFTPGKVEGNTSDGVSVESEASAAVPSRGFKRGSSSNGTNGTADKKPRVNPLIASQPYVAMSLCSVGY